MKRTLLALDQSTSATKALLVDERGRVLDRESLAHQQHYPQPGWVEHDAEEIWRNTLTVLETVVRRAVAAGVVPIGLSVANQRETIVVFDRASGCPLHRALVWQDRRGDELCSAQAAAGREAENHERTGLRLDAYFSASKLQWLLRHQPGLAQRIARGDALIGTIDTYLVYRLTQGQVFATDVTNASRTLLYNVFAGAWDDALCGWWDVSPAALPEVRECSARFGTTTLGGVLPHPVPICGVMGDSQASLLAHRCFAPGAMKATFGTGTSILLNTGARPRHSTRGLMTALGWTVKGKPNYALEGIIISSGATITWLVEQLRLARDADEIASMAAEVPDSGGVYLVPAFGGLGLPHWQPAARAAIIGLSNHSDRRHIARAALDSIGFQLCDALDAMRADAGISATALHADGGAASNPGLMQSIANLTGLEVRVPQAAECSPIGAALAGFVGLGVYDSLADLETLTIPLITYHPCHDEGLHERLRGWRNAVSQVLSVG